MNAREIAGKLTEAMRHVVLAADGSCPIRPRALGATNVLVANLRGLGVLRKSGWGRMSRGGSYDGEVLTPLGLEVRAILQESNHG